MMRLIALVACTLVNCGALAADSSLADFICDPVTKASERAQCVERAAVIVRGDKSEMSEGIPWTSIVWPSWWVVYYAFGLLIGRYIYRDARAREWLFLGVRPVWWGLLAVFEPPFGLLVYWALHYSKFAQSYHEATASPNSAPGAGP